jgi:hypothetical protein
VVSGPALPRGTSLVNASRNVVNSLGVAFLATLAASTLSPRARSIQAEANTEALAGVCTVVEQGPQAFVPGRWTEPDLVMACDESVAGFERAYTVTFIFALIALGLGTVLPGWPGGWGGRTGWTAPPVAEQVVS